MSKNTTIKTLVRTLKQAKKSYYSGKNSGLSDEQFDELEDELRQIDPDNDYFKLVGTPVGNNDKKVIHLNKMLSCQKGKTYNDIEKWAKKHNIEKELFIVEAKIDSMSGNCVYEKGKLVQINSRGDGSEGSDLSHLIPTLNVPKKIDIKTRVEVRGEIYLPKDTSLETNGSPLRNLCVGIVGRKDHGLGDLNFVKFIAYQIIGTELTTEQEKLEYLDTNGFEIVEYKICKLSELEEYRNKYIGILRDRWNYLSDGLVVCVNNNELWDKINSKYVVDKFNHYNIAWKPESESAATVLKDILWQVSRNGKLQPVAIVDPVFVSGRNVQKASLSNYGNVIRMKFKKNDKVRIEVANDVIPYLTENITQGIRQR